MRKAIVLFVLLVSLVGLATACAPIDKCKYGVCSPGEPPKVEEKNLCIAVVGVDCKPNIGDNPK